MELKLARVKFKDHQWHAEFVKPNSKLTQEETNELNTYLQSFRCAIFFATQDDDVLIDMYNDPEYHQKGDNIWIDCLILNELMYRGIKI